MFQIKALQAFLIASGSSLLLLSAVPARAQDLSPPFVAVTEFGREGSNSPPLRQSLSESEVALLERFATDLGDSPFPQYPYSGCQERAHAAYILLPPELRERAMKIWVASPAVLTIGMPGSIRLRATDEASARVNWGYHVALAFDIDGQLRIYDPVLAPAELIDEAAWFGKMTISPRSLWTLTAGDIYLFFSEQFDKKAYVVNRDVWSGNTARYLGSWVTENWVPRSLARDVVALEAMAGRSCAEFEVLKEEPGLLQEELVKREGPMVAACGQSFALYDRELNRWIERLSPSNESEADQR